MGLKGSFDLACSMIDGNQEGLLRCRRMKGLVKKYQVSILVVR